MFNKEVKYACTRFTGTWVRVKGREGLSYFGEWTRVTEDFDKAEISTLDDKVVNDRFLLKDVIFEPPRLGYVNSSEPDKDAVYVSRLPKRHDWRQGIRSCQLVSISNNGKVSSVSSKWFQDEIISIGKTVDNKFLSFKKTLEVVEEYSRSYAFNRQFALDYKGNLLYKGFRCGKLTIKKLKLNPDLNYLEHELTLAVGVDNIVF